MVRVRGDVNNGLKADGMVRIESDKSDKSVVKKYIVRVRRNLTRIKQMRRGSHGMHGTHGSWLLYLSTSVASVGGYFSRKVCGFCVFCGN